MEKTVQLYEGKAKKVFATEDPELVIVSYKDDATALDGLKKGTIVGKGAINNRMSNYLMQILEKRVLKLILLRNLTIMKPLLKRFQSFPLRLLSETFQQVLLQSVSALKRELYSKSLQLNFLIKTMIFTIRL